MEGWMKLSRISLAYYRDGQASVAWHGDYVARRLENALVATVSLENPADLPSTRKAEVERARFDLVLAASSSWEGAVSALISTPYPR
jgi:alkylated DNA repair dioxygenase AlkB